MLHMTRSTKAAVVLFLPLCGCAQPVIDDAPPAVLAAPSPEDRRPDVGTRPQGEDLTEIARRQNAPGQEPPLPTRRGTVTMGARPWVQRTQDGFLARLPGARNVPTPAYHRGRVYTGGYGTYELHSIHAKTGRPAWSLHLSDDGPTDPACQEGICVFNTYSCTIFGVDAEKGTHLWSWYLGSPQLATPVVAGDIVYTSYPGSGNSFGARYVLAAFELKTGKPLWRRWMDAEVNSTPVAHRGRVYVATRVGTLYELSAKEGDILSVRKNQIASPPVFVAERALFGRAPVSRENDLLATSSAVFPELEPTAAQPAHDEVQPRPRPLVAQHRLVTIDRGVLVATHRATGQPLWQQRFDGEGPANVSAPLLQAGPSLLLATSHGNVLRIEPDTGEVIGVYRLGAGSIASQPIAVDGWIYAGTTSGSVVAFDTGDGELTGWEMLGGGPDRRGTLDPEDT
jgi:outer membrane protein assembly factor BamB